MRVVTAMGRLGGVADAATLRLWVPRRAIRRALRHGEIVPEARGRYALPTADEALRAANRLTGVVSHRSAAAWWGWELKRQPERPTVTVPRNRNVAPERRTDVDVRWADLPVEEVVDPRVTSAARTVVDCARALPFDEALVIGDAALRHGDVTRARLVELADRVTGKGRAGCLRVAREASGTSASPVESVLRALALDVRGLDLRPRPEVVVGTSRVVPVLADEARRIALEVDEPAVEAREASARHNALVLGGWSVLRFSWEHAMREPEYVTACLRELVAGRPARVRPARGGTAAAATHDR